MELSWERKFHKKISHGTLWKLFTLVPLSVMHTVSYHTLIFYSSQQIRPLLVSFHFEGKYASSC